jgi:hypothetical protein
MYESRSYQFTFFDDDPNVIVAALTLLHPSDGDAVTEADVLLNVSAHHSMEVWQGSRHICSRWKGRSPADRGSGLPRYSSHP